LRYVVPKGSIAVDGVSLTVVDVNHDKFSVALIPHTAAVTTLGERSKGDLVNIEIDIVSRYVNLLQPTK
jgi:riboflavin synthase